MEAILFIGIQGSGKTTFYRERFFTTHVRISLDMLKTRRREHILLQACLVAQQRFVVDNTNVLAVERARYIGPAKAAGFRVIGYYFLPDLHAVLRRNDLRSGKARIPAKGVVGTFKRLKPPTLAEGYDQLYTVCITSKDQFIVDAFSPSVYS